MEYSKSGQELVNYGIDDVGFLPLRFWTDDAILNKLNSHMGMWILQHDYDFDLNNDRHMMLFDKHCGNEWKPTPWWEHVISVLFWITVLALFLAGAYLT